MPAPRAGARNAQLFAWLADRSGSYQLDLASASAIRADAGARRYFRIVSTGPHGPTLIAVDAPPPEKCHEFQHVSRLLLDAGIHAPRVLDADFERGFMLITDLGRITYLDQLQSAHLGAAQRLFIDALHTLIEWQRATRAGILPDYDKTLLRRELELFPEWYLQRHLGFTLTPAQRAALDAVYAVLIRNAAAQPHVFTHSDYMPRNLMVSAPNPGVLDFQDAVTGPLTYDLGRSSAMLLSVGKKISSATASAITISMRGKSDCRCVLILNSSTVNSNGWACNGISKFWGYSRGFIIVTERHII